MAQVRISLSEAEGELPLVCLRCGAKADVRVARRMQWRPSWIAWFLLLGVLPYFWLLFRTTRTVRLNVPFCARHRHHWLWRGVAVVGGFALLLGIVIAGLSLVNEFPEGRVRRVFSIFVFLAGASLLILWSILVLCCQKTAVRTHLITDTEITLDGVSPTFIEALVDWDIRPTPAERDEAIQILLHQRLRVAEGTAVIQQDGGGL